MRRIGSRESAQSDLPLELLRNFWRQPTPPFEITAKALDEAVPWLLSAGVAALAFWRLRDSELRASPAGETLQNVYRQSTLEAALQERAIEQVFSLLRSAGCEPILIKGWAIARLYPQKGLRPYGDIDLCVRPEQRALAEQVFKTLEAAQGEEIVIDLHHEEINCLNDRSWEQLYERSKVLRLRNTDVRIPGDEDHLRILCLHWLSSGAWRPLGLCDIPVAVAAREANFNWEFCLGDNRRKAKWIGCAVGVAHHLLGLTVDGTPVEQWVRKMPKWLLPTVLNEWKTPHPDDHAPLRHPRPMASYWRSPRGVFRAIGNRWPNPIAATLSVRGAFNEWPRLPYQVGNWLLRSRKFIFR